MSDPSLQSAPQLESLLGQNDSAIVGDRRLHRNALADFERLCAAARVAGV